MRTICIKTKLKKGVINEVRAWFKTIRERQDEALETLTNEGVLVESAYIDRQGDDYYLIYYLKANDVDFAYQVFAKSTLAIDQYYKECWQKYCEGRQVLEELLDIDRIDCSAVSNKYQGTA